MKWVTCGPRSAAQPVCIPTAAQHPQPTWVHCIPATSDSLLCKLAPQHQPTASLSDGAPGVVHGGKFGVQDTHSGAAGSVTHCMPFIRRKLHVLIQMLVRSAVSLLRRQRILLLRRNSVGPPGRCHQFFDCACAAAPPPKRDFRGLIDFLESPNNDSSSQQLITTQPCLALIVHSRQSPAGCSS